MEARSTPRAGSGIPLKVLIADQDKAAVQTLSQALNSDASVLEIRSVSEAQEAVGAMFADRDPAYAVAFNTIFIDPLSLGLDAAGDFILRTRAELPAVVFVLYIDKERVEQRRSEFYRGERRRFSHYFVLDKRTPVGAFSVELGALLTSCQAYLKQKLSTASIDRLRQEADRLATTSTAHDESLLGDIRKLISQVASEREPRRDDVRTNTVFVSHRFAEEEYVNGLSKLLRQSGFEPVIGKSAATYVSKAVLDRIRESEFFLCLMTRGESKADGTYTTSAWILEEKGAALAFGKPLVLMVEEGVTDVGGLQGDWQRIHFGAKGFLVAALEAVEQLKSYAGAG